MAQLNELFSFSFEKSSDTITAEYFFTPESLQGQKATKGVVWLAIKTEQFTIKVLKPESILKQPKEIIEKIVQRELVQQQINELTKQ